MFEVSSARPMAAPSPLLLLLRVNALQAWRRLKSIRNQSRLLTGLITSFMAGYWVLSFWLFYQALRFVAAFPGLGTVLTERLLYLLFAFLFVMLLLSNVVISYTNLFRNREANQVVLLRAIRIVDQNRAIGTLEHEQATRRGAHDATSRDQLADVGE